MTAFHRPVAYRSTPAIQPSANQLAIAACAAAGSVPSANDEQTTSSVPPSRAARSPEAALAADAALQLTCHAHGALPHLLSFHLGGVVLVAAAAAAVIRSARVTSRS